LDVLQEAGQKITAKWNELEKNKKFLLLALGGTVLFALIISIFFLGRVTYVPLFTELDSLDAQRVVEFLDSQGVPYKIGDDGNSVLVGRDRVHQLRLQMAGEGVPSGGVVGFEVFDSTRLGTTEFERQINFYRALSGELARTISTMEAVENARVQITTPRDRLFVQDEEPVQASILLQVSPVRRLEPGQVNSIRHLVAGSVDGLKPENVTVVDTSGKLLSGELNFSDNNHLSREATRTNMEMQRLFEKQLQQDLERMLIPVLGYDNFVVNVNAILDFDLREEQMVRYEPVIDDRGIIRSEQIKEESYSGTGADPGGVPGTDPNIPLYESSDFYRDVDRDLFDSVTNYEINEVVSNHIYAPGSLERLSVGVIINQPVDQGQIDGIEQTLATAIGFDEGRGDSLNVAQVAFDDSLAREMETMAAAEEAARRQEMYIYLGAILTMAFILFYIVRRLTAGRKIPAKKAVEEGFEEEPGKEGRQELTQEEKERQEIKREISRLINEKPEKAANLLKAWLVEE